MPFVYKHVNILSTTFTHVWNPMKYCTKPATLIISMILLTNPLWADESRYWQCTTSDGDNKQWMLKSIYERSARGKTTDACKKQSQIPASCKTDCEGFNHGLSTRPSWTCTALDQNAKPWVSAAYTSYDDAAIAAKARCKELSSMPDSCFLNVATCKNLNQWP